MNIMTPRVEAGQNLERLGKANISAETPAKPISHFKQCHCSCTAGQRVIAVFVTALAVLQIVVLALSVQSSAPRGYETLSDVNTALGSGAR